MGLKETKLSAFIDSGADLTVVNMSKFEESSLKEKPPISVMFIKSPDYVGLAPIYPSKIRVKNIELNVLVAIAPILEEAIIGRDLMNQIIIMLDGPQKVASIYIKG